MVKTQIKPLSDMDLTLGLPIETDSKELIALNSPTNIDRDCPV